MAKTFITMNRYFLIAIIALTVFSAYSYGSNSVSGKPERLIREFRANEGFHTIGLGRLGTGLAKGILKMVLAADANEEALRVCNCFYGISSVRVTVYEECEDRIIDNFNRRMSGIFDRCEMLMEIKDRQDKISLFSESGAYYLFIPGECVLIRFTGRIDTEALMRIAVKNI